MNKVEAEEGAFGPTAVKVRLGELLNDSEEEMAVWDHYEQKYAPVPAGHTADVEFTNGKQRVLGIRAALTEGE